MINLIYFVIINNDSYKTSAPLKFVERKSDDSLFESDKINKEDADVLRNLAKEICIKLKESINIINVYRLNNRDRYNTLEGDPKFEKYRNILCSHKENTKEIV